MENRSILISGASIAGPALAYWLHRYGFRPTVVEQAPTMRDGGYAVDIRGVAVDVVERMGILPAVRQASTDMRGASYVNRTGKRLANVPADLFGGREGEDEEILRGDLARILHQATKDDVEYLFGDSIATVVQGEEGVEVTFENGGSRTFDLVIGADGLHSKVRGLAFGDESQFIRPLDHYAAIFTVPNYLHLDHWSLLHATPGRTAGLYSARGNTEAKAMFFFASPPLAYDHGDIEQQRQLLAAAFAGAGWEIPRLLGLMRDAPDFYFDAISQIQMDCWSNGHVALVGDAGYCPSPASGQGTSLALVGAYVLAGELKAAAGDYHTAFSRYEHAMRGYVAQNQQLARKFIGGLVVPTRSMLWFRTQMVRLLPHLPWKNLLVGGVLRAIHEAANAITLPDYGNPPRVVAGSDAPASRI